MLPARFEFDPGNLAPAEAERETFERLTAERERLGPVNLVAESELAELDANRAQGAAERDELQEAINRLRGSIGSLNREGRVRLLDAFEKVNTHFQSLFTTLFDGGHAHLELVESDDPLWSFVLVQSAATGPLQAFLSAWRAWISAHAPRNIRWSLDVDPQDID